MKKVKIIRKFPCGKVEESFVEIGSSEKVITSKKNISTSKKTLSKKDSPVEDEDDKNSNNEETE